MKYTESDLILHIENRIPAYYVSLNGQIKFYTLAGMLLESAAIHASLHGFGYHDMLREQVYWVLSRFHVIVHTYPMMDDPVRIETWHKGSNRLFYMRDFRMLSEHGRLLCSATSAWLILDGHTGRPKKIDGVSQPNEFLVKDRHAIEGIPDKLPEIIRADRQIQVAARYSDLDINKHVNAINYIEWIQDCYDEKVYEVTNVREFQINYQLETRFGEQVDIRIKEHPPGEPFDYLEGRRTTDRNLAFQARISFGKFE
jgi:acyl-ACP thioesterase